MTIAAIFVSRDFVKNIKSSVKIFGSYHRLNFCDIMAEMIDIRSCLWSRKDFFIPSVDPFNPSAYATTGRCNYCRNFIDAHPNGDPFNGDDSVSSTEIGEIMTLVGLLDFWFDYCWIICVTILLLDLTASSSSMTSHGNSGTNCSGLTSDDQSASYNDSDASGKTRPFYHSDVTNVNSMLLIGKRKSGGEAENGNDFKKHCSRDGSGNLGISSALDS